VLDPFAETELADPERARRFDHADEQIRRAVDRLSPGLCRHRPIWWNTCSTLSSK
jgi:hypothetical protein